MPYPGVPNNLTQKMERCVKDVMSKGKDKSTAIAMCHAQIVPKKEHILENIEFNFTPESIQITEGEKQPDGMKWIKIGGTALTEGISRNNNVYTFENLQENSGNDFKWLFGHPDEPEEHIIGKGILKLDGGVLKHEGHIRNTSRHPDVVESVKDGFLGPSIHASARKVVESEGKYHIEGLRIEGIGLVGFQGVKDASIDYAIAESFRKNAFTTEKEDLVESVDTDDVNNDTEVNTMSEEIKEEVVPQEAPQVVEAAPVVEKKEENDELIKLREEIASLKQLLVKEEEPQTEAIVEPEEETVETEEVVERDGGISLGERAYRDFNKEIRERIR